MLAPAITEINEKSDLFVEVEQIKRGRAIHALKFVISHKNKQSRIFQNLQNQGSPKLPQRPQVKERY